MFKYTVDGKLRFETTWSQDQILYTLNYHFYLKDKTNLLCFQNWKWYLIILL